MSLSIDLNNKRAFVSGATQGIGLGVARALARAGCDVVGCALCAPGSETALNFVKTVESYGRSASYFQADLTEKKTPASQIWFDTFGDPAAERTRTEQLHPVGRMGTVDEIGALCAFLASPFAGFISGTTLLVDGGRSALMQDR